MGVWGPRRPPEALGYIPVFPVISALPGINCTLYSCINLQQNKVIGRKKIDKKRQYKTMTTLMEIRIYNLFMVMKMGHALDLQVTLTKE